MATDFEKMFLMVGNAIDTHYHIKERHETRFLICEVPVDNTKNLLKSCKIIFSFRNKGQTFNGINIEIEEKNNENRI